MLHVQSKITSQGQVSIPASVRALLGITPGSALEWLQEGDHVVVRRAVRHSTNAVHQALFPADKPASPPKTLNELKQGIRQQVKRRHAGA